MLMGRRAPVRVTGGIKLCAAVFCTHRIQLRTTLRVPAGGELYASYTHSLLPTMLRREQLLEGKYFACACPRCSDPTELGTHMSSLKCNKCDNGIILPLDSLGICIARHRSFSASSSLPILALSVTNTRGSQSI